MVRVGGGTVFPQVNGEVESLVPPSSPSSSSRAEWLGSPYRPQANGKVCEYRVAGAIEAGLTQAKV